MKEENKLQNLVFQTRRDILRMVNKVNSGHPGGSLGCTEFFIALYHEVMEINENFSMDGYNEDVFFLIKRTYFTSFLQHTLARRGFFFSISELSTFRLINSRLQGHPTTHDNLPGIRIASGSLGQGLSVALGASLSKKLNNDNKLVYILLGDGELQEGQNWEAAMFASANKVDNIIATVDLNGKQIDGSTDEVLSLGDLKNKFLSFGWEILELKEGNNIDLIIKTLKKAKALTRKEKPVIILMETEMGNGVDYMMGTHKWHGVAPNDELLLKALDQNPETIGDY